MEITIRHVVELSPAFEALVRRLLDARGAPGAVPAREQDGPDGAVGVAEAQGAEGSPQAAPAMPPQAGRQRDLPAAVSASRVLGRLWRTAEREARLRELWPGPLTVARVIADLATLEGPRMPLGDSALYGWATELGLPLPRPGRLAVDNMGGRPRAGWRTPERAAVVRELWPQGVPRDEVLARLHALPGDPVEPSRLSVWAAEMGVKRPEGWAAASTSRVMARAVAARSKPEAVAASNVQRGVEAARERIAVSLVPEAPRPVAPALPPVAETGRVYASFQELRAWAGFYGLAYDGSDVERLNKFRAAKGLPPVVQDEARAA